MKKVNEENSWHSLSVLVTRPFPQGEALCHAITAVGYKAIHFPTIAFAPYLSPLELEQRLENLHEQDWLIFISPQSVYAGITEIRRFLPHLLDTVKLAAVGAGTAKALAEAGYNIVVYPELEWNSEGFLALPAFQPEQIKGKKITLIRGAGGREKIDTILSARGAQVSALMVYQRVIPKIHAANLQHCLTLIKQGQLHGIICTSYESVQNLKNIIGNIDDELIWRYFADIPLIVVSERIKNLAQVLGFRRIWVSRNASQAAILATLEQLADKKDKVMIEPEDQNENINENGKENKNEVNDKMKIPAKHTINIGIIMFVLVLIASLGGFGYGYYQLSQVNIQLAQMITNLQNRVTNTQTNNQTDKQALQQTVNDIKATLQKSQTLSTEQEQLIHDWHAAQQGDLNKWRVAEAQNLTKLADTQLQYAHDVKAAIILLQQADQTLQNTQQNILLSTIHQSLLSDLTLLQSLQPIDKSAVFLRLHELNQLVDKLSLTASPFKTDKQQNADNQNVGNQNPNKSWWKAGLELAWNNISKLVIVRKTDANATPLVLPDEKVFLYQNLHMQLENASWGLLHDNAEVYKTALIKAQQWTQQYFEPNAEETKTLLAGLSELQQLNVTPPTAGLIQTLKLFDEYFAPIKN